VDFCPDHFAGQMVKNSSGGEIHEADQMLNNRIVLKIG
jgi:hypothetical protein